MSTLIGKQVVVTLKRSIICTTPKHRAFMQTLEQLTPIVVPAWLMTQLRRSTIRNRWTHTRASHRMADG